MPLPKPSSGESRDDFIRRCSGDDKVINEFPDGDQRVAVCISQYNEGSKMTEENHQVDVEEYIAEQEAKKQDGHLDVKFEIKAMDDPEQKGEFSGYGSIFGNQDLGNDIVEKGAFAQSIGRKGARAIKMLYQHRADEPIGVFDEIIEDNRGLKVKGRLAMGTQRGREVYELMKMGAIDSLSIGYRVDAKGYHYDDKGKRRYLKSLDLMEISAVTFPMNPKARVSSVKTDRTVREWEEVLRDAADLSRSEAKVAASAVAKALEQRDAGTQEMPLEVVSEVEKLTKILKS
jgi:uncharacterized protein